MRTPDDEQHVQPRDGVDRDRGERGDHFTGSVILRLSRHLEPGDGPDLREHTKALGLKSLVAYLDELEQPPTQRVITSVEPGKLLELEEQAKEGPLPPLHSLTQYWRIDAKGLRPSLEEVVQRLSRLDAVELAYPEMAAFDPVAGAGARPLAGPVTRLVSTVTRLLAGRQGYLGAAPKGIDARWAWNQPGGEGQWVGVADIERGWVLAHEALQHPNPAMIPIRLRHPPTGQPGDELINEHGQGAYAGHHGTHVMGVIGAPNNPLGIGGVAPSLRPEGPGRRALRAASVFNGVTAGLANVANAVIGASNAMQPGDVLLVEVQTPDGRLPAETDNAAHTAIRLASHTRIVVEAAGNGDQNLNPNWDSGAIVVGACQVTSRGAVNCRKTATSNYGPRVNCFAWGDWVETCGGPFPTDSTSYHPRFSGTSSAAAIIAGAAALTQSMNLARRPGRPLSAHEMRDILSDPHTGTTSPDAIGAMPNLKLIKTNVLDHIL